ncbi:MAG: hypothetical protein RR363_07450 [Rikenellaceae bacterium]
MKDRLIKKLQILIRAYGLEDAKKDMYASYGVISSKEMTEAQLINLISAIKQGVPCKSKQEQNSERKRLISDCLNVITGVGWMRFPNGKWDDINKLVRGDRFGKGKILSQMSSDELKDVHKKLIMAHKNGLRYENKDVFFKSQKKSKEVIEVSFIGINNNIIN